MDHKDSSLGCLITGTFVLILGFIILTIIASEVFG